MVSVESNPLVILAMKEIYKEYKTNRGKDEVTFHELNECMTSRSARKFFENDNALRQFAKAHPSVNNLVKASIWQFNLPLAAVVYNNM